MYGVQKAELHHHPEQKATDRESAAEKILQIRQKAHFAQGGKIVLCALLCLELLDD
jgi:hypothetical protein